MQEITKAEKTVLLLVTLAVIIGITLELLLGDCSNMFQRFGAVIVCIGIIFGALDLKSAYAQEYKNTIEVTENNRMENDAVWSDKNLGNEARGTTNYFQTRANSIRESGEKRVVMIDAAVLVVGTLIWGFGDLIL